MDKLLEKYCIKVDNIDEADIVVAYSKYWKNVHTLEIKKFPIYFSEWGICGSWGWDTKNFWSHPVITFNDFKRLVLKTDNNMEYKLTKETILKMAEESSEVKKSLKKAFPDVFEDERYLEIRTNEILRDCNRELLIQRRIGGKYINKAFYLNSDYAWEIVADEEGELCLIPTKKQ